MIACLSANDHYVMSEWAKVQGCDGMIVMLADEDGCDPAFPCLFTAFPYLFTVFSPFRRLRCRTRDAADGLGRQAVLHGSARNNPSALIPTHRPTKKQQPRAVQAALDTMSCR